MSTMFQQQANWKLKRLGKFTASEIYKLMQPSKVKSNPFSQIGITYINKKIAEIITGEQAGDLSGLRAIEWGLSNEMDAILTFEQQTGLPVEYFGGADPKFFDYNAYSGGSPDGLMETRVIEVKCPYDSSKHTQYLLLAKSENQNAELKALSPEYYGQVQFNMLCTGKKQAYFLSYDPRTIEHYHRLAVLEINYDDTYIEILKAKIEMAAVIVDKALQVLTVHDPSLPSVRVIDTI